MAQSWIELDAGMPLPGPLELPTSVVLSPADGAGDGLHRVRGHGNEALRRRLVTEFLAMGFEVAQARHDPEGGLVAGPWVLKMRPPLDLAPAAATLSVRGQVRIRALAVGAFPVRSDGDLLVEAEAHWQAPLETARSARIGQGCRLDGPLSCQGLLDLGADSIVSGGVRCSTLRLGARARLAGGVALRAQSAARPALVAVHRHGARAPAPAPTAAFEQEPTFREDDTRPAPPRARRPRTRPPPVTAAPSPGPAAPPVAPLGQEAPPLVAQPTTLSAPTTPPTPQLVGGSWHYFELPARADLQLDEPQAWRLLAAADWLDIPSRETLREQELEFEGRSLGSYARFGILRDRRHLQEVEVPNAEAAEGDHLLGLVTRGPHPVQVRGRVHRGRLHLTLRTPDHDSLSEMVARVATVEAAPDDAGTGIATEAPRP